MKNRSRGLILEDNCLLLIRRIKNDRDYYVFPGGGIEAGETPEQCIKREAKEELGVTLNVLDLKYQLHEKDGSVQNFFYCTIKEGKIGTGIGPEFTHKDYSGRGQYIPTLTKVDSLENISLYPLEIRDAFIEDIINHKCLKNIPFKEIYEQ
ncbi:NUDIX domain-containing protein [Candidatus Woesearchaeota archaeon]|nr:NUDIX domain-containing protein [Candidatus Woesearchaeota archaeon]